MRVLLIWEEVPENTKFFALDGLVAEKAIRAHGCFINLVDGDPDGAAEALNDALADMEPIDHSAPLDAARFDKVVWAGFVM